MEQQAWAQFLLDDEELQATAREIVFLKKEAEMVTPDIVSQERVASLMIIMTMREMPLSEAQLAQLRRVSYERLPNVELA